MSRYQWQGSNLLIYQFHRLIPLSFLDQAFQLVTVGLLATLPCVGSTDQMLITANQHNNTRKIPI